MILFHFQDFKKRAQELLRLPFIKEGFFTVERYHNQELHISISGAPIADEDCMILGSIAPPDEHLLAFALLAHTLKKEGARKVVALLPYLAYARNDRKKPRESLGTAWVGTLLKTSGIDEIVTVDLHSSLDSELMPLPIVSIPPAELFAALIAKNDLRDATIVAPDRGAIQRCEDVRSTAAIPEEIVHFEKHRTSAGGVTISDPIGTIGERAVIIDDILDTGTTLVLASRALQKKGVKEIYIMVAHGVFSGSYWKKLYAMRGVKKIFCTDTVPHRAMGDKIAFISASPVILKTIKEYYIPK